MADVTRLKIQTIPMLGIFEPTCPVDAETKAWIERRFDWLTQEFGFHHLTSRETMLPTADFLPLEYDCTEDGIYELMKRVANRMDVDYSLLDLNFYEDNAIGLDGAVSPASAGLYAEKDGRYQIWLEVNCLDDPGGVIATLAHEIGHFVLLGQKRIEPDTDDQEELTDLLVVFNGLGVFAANASLHETNIHGSGYSAWSVGKRGYLSMHAIGYALALYSLARGLARPDWLKHLRPDAKAYVSRGIRYVTKVQDCSYRPAIERCG